MQKRNVPIFTVSALLISLFAVGIGVGQLVRGATDSREVAAPTPRTLQQIDFVSLAKKIGPAVVHVATTQTTRPTPNTPNNPNDNDDQFDEFWRRFFGGPPPGQGQGPSRRQGLGSGFLIDRNGTILTNNHVVENADKIIVRLSDQREMPAKLLGRDPKTDIAVIKIEAKDDLPVVTLGDADKLEVGEWVAAMGSPFGLDNTITAGIVSAKGRALGAGPYDDFIQTDASINPGNSGGPLINMAGQVIGINTAIFSRNGGNMGIGFAISINLVKDLLPELREKGKVTRGWLGVAVQQVTPELASSLGIGEPRGALVAGVNDGSPAARVGMKVGDVIISFDGKPIKESSQLPLLVARTPIGKTVPVTVLRNNQQLTMNTTIAVLKDEEIVAAASPTQQEFGLTVQQVTPQIARSLGLDKPQGVVVTAVDPTSAAAESGLHEGDLILEIDRRPIGTLAEFNQAIKAGANKNLLFLVRRGENTLFLALAPQVKETR